MGQLKIDHSEKMIDFGKIKSKWVTVKKLDLEKESYLSFEVTLVSIFSSTGKNFSK